METGKSLGLQKQACASLLCLARSRCQTAHLVQDLCKWPVCTAAPRQHSPEQSAASAELGPCPGSGAVPQVARAVGADLQRRSWQCYYRSLHWCWGKQCFGCQNGGLWFMLVVLPPRALPGCVAPCWSCWGSAEAPEHGCDLALEIPWHSETAASHCLNLMVVLQYLRRVQNFVPEGENRPISLRRPWGDEVGVNTKRSGYRAVSECCRASPSLLGHQPPPSNAPGEGGDVGSSV